MPFALGSETSGSILTPSAYCGVTGLRPTYGLVSRAGAMALSWTLDKIGPMARSADDCGHILQAIAGGDSADPGSAGKRFNYAPQFPRDLTSLKLGWAPADFSDWGATAKRSRTDTARNAATVARVVRMVDRSEYKRRQAPPGVKITPKAFGRDRRVPISNAYRGGWG